MPASRTLSGMRRPVDLERGAALGGGQLDGAHGHPVRLDVVGVAVEAVRVVRDEHLRAYLSHDLHQVPGGLVEVGLPEGPGVLVGREPHHPGVAVAAGAAEEAVVGDAERGARGGQLGDAVPAELVGLGGGELGQRRHVDLALLAERAGHQRDVRAVGGVVGHRRAGADRLVVGVRVDQQQAAVGQHRHDGHSNRRFSPGWR